MARHLMKLVKLLLKLGWFIVAVPLCAQTTTYTGTIKDLSLNVVTSGQVTFTLTPPTDSTLPGIGRFTPSSTSCNINSDGSLSGYVGGVVSRACIVVSNTALSPAGTAYRICIQAYGQTPGSCFFDYAITASKDITTIAPTLQTGPLNYNGVPGPPGCVIGTTCVGALTTTPVATQAVTQPAGTSLNVNILNNTRSVLGYGAKCDGATDDTVAFQAASNAAHTGSGVQTIVIPSGTCVVAGQVTVYSGQYWTGQGTILVPKQTGHTFYAQNADNVTFDGINITVTTPAAGSPDDSAIAWYAVSDSAAHQGFYVRHCNVINSSWGIFALYSSGTGSLSNVDIAENTVTSNTIYTNGDGIHLGGRISNFTIRDNRVYNRGDAGIGATSEVVSSTTYTLSGGKISNNILLEDLVGLDNSGGTNIEWSGNYVKATTAAPSIQNPAFRSITYPFTASGVYPVGVHAFNNYFYSGNNSGVATTVKFDPIISGQSSWPSLNSSFEKNVIDGPNTPLYIRGKGLSVGDNTFVNGGTFLVDYDGSDNVATANVVLGTNKWLAAGSMSFGAGCALYSGISLQPQASFAAVTYTNLSCIGTQTYTLPGDLTIGNNATINSSLKVGTGVTIRNTNAIPQVGTPTVGQASCIKSAGPPVVIGYCSTVVSAGGACTCN
jgi:parallel beta-helix repeat protein